MDDSDELRCLCSCHDALGRGVDVRHPIEAVLACIYCLDDHVPALTYKPPEDWKPDSTGDEGPEVL